MVCGEVRQLLFRAGRRSKTPRLETLLLHECENQDLGCEISRGFPCQRARSRHVKRTPLETTASRSARNSAVGSLYLQVWKEINADDHACPVSGGPAAFGCSWPATGYIDPYDDELNPSQTLGNAVPSAGDKEDRRPTTFEKPVKQSPNYIVARNRRCQCGLTRGTVIAI